MGRWHALQGLRHTRQWVCEASVGVSTVALRLCWDPLFLWVVRKTWCYFVAAGLSLTAVSRPFPQVLGDKRGGSVAGDGLQSGYCLWCSNQALSCNRKRQLSRRGPLGSYTKRLPVCPACAASSPVTDNYPAARPCLPCLSSQG